MDMEKVKVLYTIGDSFVYGHGLDSRWSTTLSKKIGGLDCNVSLTGSSNDRTFRTVVDASVLSSVNVICLPSFPVLNDAIDNCRPRIP